MDYIVYAKTDEQGCIIGVNSSDFVEAGWGVQIDSGEGDKYHHAQGNYCLLYTSTLSNSDVICVKGVHNDKRKMVKNYQCSMCLLGD